MTPPGHITSRGVIIIPVVITIYDGPKTQVFPYYVYTALILMTRVRVCYRTILRVCAKRVRVPLPKTKATFKTKQKQYQARISSTRYSNHKYSIKEQIYYNKICYCSIITRAPQEGRDHEHDQNINGRQRNQVEADEYQCFSPIFHALLELIRKKEQSRPIKSNQEQSRGESCHIQHSLMYVYRVKKRVQYL